MLKFNQEKKDFDETIEDLNTSYVKVQFITPLAFHILQFYLNTSYVKVQ